MLSLALSPMLITPPCVADAICEELAGAALKGWPASSPNPAVGDVVIVIVPPPPPMTTGHTVGAAGGMLIAAAFDFR